MGYYFERYCKDYENIENYEAAKKCNFKGWDCHHRLETWNSDGERRLVDITKKELQALGMYYHRPPEELIFLTSREHTALHKKGKHNPFYGKKHSDETIRKLSLAHKGKRLSEEHKKKLSEANKGKRLSEETRRRMSEARKNISAETRRKLGEANKGTYWFNNGKTNIRAKECPDGFVPGRLK